MHPSHFSSKFKTSPKPARKIVIWPGRISAIMNGKRANTAGTALRLAKYFGTPSEPWLGLQSEYDLRIAKRTIGP